MTDNKLQYIVGQLLSNYRKANNPEFVELVELFLKYLHENVYVKIESLQDFYTDKVNTSFIDELIEQYANELIDTTAIELSDEQKKLFSTKSKYVNNLKVTKSSYEFLFRYLKESTAYYNDSVTIGDLNIRVVDDATFGTFKYSYISDEYLSTENFYDIIKGIHPAGFKFIIDLQQTEQQNNIITIGVGVTVSTTRVTANKYMGIKTYGAEVTHTPIEQRIT
jgi:hypothetical protein